MMTPAQLEAIAVALFGAAWQRSLARAVGPYVPSGPRDSIDDRLVRRWAAGQRPIPVWIPEALLRICQERRVAVEQAEKQLQEILRSAPESP